MHELDQEVASAITNMRESGAIQKLVADNVSKTVASIVAEALSSYSDFGKQLAAAVKGAIRVDAAGLGLEGYNHAVLGIVKAQLDQVLEEQGRKQIQENLTALLGDWIPHEVKLSELVRDFVECVSGRHGKHSISDRKAGDRITLIVQRKYGSVYIYLDAKERTEFYRCAHSLRLDEKTGATLSVTIDSRDTTKTIFAGPLYGFEKTLFQIYATGSKVIVDEQACELELPDPEFGDE